MTCKKHPKYKGIHKPRVWCEHCWAIWLGLSEMCINSGCLDCGYRRLEECGLDEYDG